LAKPRRKGDRYERDDYDIAHWKTFVIDGVTYKPDTWYTLNDGQIVEVTE
jgi:hypothetical protein